MSARFRCALAPRRRSLRDLLNGVSEGVQLSGWRRQAGRPGVEAGLIAWERVARPGIACRIDPAMRGESDIDLLVAPSPGLGCRIDRGIRGESDIGFARGAQSGPWVSDRPRHTGSIRHWLARGRVAMADPGDRRPAAVASDRTPAPAGTPPLPRTHTPPRCSSDRAGRTSARRAPAHHRTWQTRKLEITAAESAARSAPTHAPRIPAPARAPRRTPRTPRPRSRAPARRARRSSRRRGS